MKKAIIGTVLGIVLGFVLGIIGIVLSQPSEIDTANISVGKLREYSNSGVIMVSDTFLSKESAMELANQITDTVLCSPELKIMSQITKVPSCVKEITLLIDSNGGYVGLMFGLVNGINNMKAYFGVKFKCLINNASSSAFTFVQAICDKRILLKDGKMLQHKVYGESEGIVIYNNDTTITSIQMSDLEADRIGINKDEWYKISRENGDKSFTVKEMLKYNLIDEVENVGK